MPQKIIADLLWTFGIGTGYHRAFQDEFLPSLGPVFQGGWVRTNAARTAAEVGPVRPETLTATPWIEQVVFSFRFSKPIDEHVRVRREHVRLHCTPIVNLFEHDGDPLRLGCAVQPFSGRAKRGAIAPAAVFVVLALGVFFMG